MTEERKHTGDAARGPEDEHAGARPARVEARREDTSGPAADQAVEREGQSAGEFSDHLETRLPQEPGEGPGSPQGDALLDGSGSRHGADASDERRNTD